MPRKDAHAMGEPLMSLTGRFPVSVVARIDAHTEAMRLAMPGLNIGRSDALRILAVQALDALYGPTTGAVAGTVTDTTVTDPAQLRRMFQQELRAFFAGRPPYQGTPPVQSVTDTITDTIAHAEAVVSASPETWTVTDTVTVTVTDTVTDTLSAPEPAPVVTDTVSVTETVTETVTVTAPAPALEPFDTARYVLGKLCPRNHDYQGTGQSLLRRTNRHCCACDREKFQERGKVQRQTRKQAKRQAPAL